jgi:predicted ATP-dependent endonuclease of OLD family
MSTRSTWESSITPHLDRIPFEDIGRGEQSSLQIKLAIEGAAGNSILLIEEPENHLSHSNMSRLIEQIDQKSAGRQTIVTTHSSFVLNKLGINNVTIVGSGRTMTLADLRQETWEYFRRIAGYDTLRLVLSRQVFLVEGPSDELIVQKAYQILYGKLPLQNGIDVIAVGSLAFLRFLEIGVLLGLNVVVITDNDGNVAALKKKYVDYLGGQYPNIKVYYDKDEHCKTLEPQLLKANGREFLNNVFGKPCDQDDDLLKYMWQNKTDCALSLFDWRDGFSIPDYIKRAIQCE